MSNKNDSSVANISIVFQKHFPVFSICHQNDSKLANHHSLQRFLVTFKLHWTNNIYQEIKKQSITGFC